MRHSPAWQVTWGGGKAPGGGVAGTPRDPQPIRLFSVKFKESRGVSSVRKIEGRLRDAREEWCRYELVKVTGGSCGWCDALRKFFSSFTYVFGRVTS